MEAIADPYAEFRLVCTPSCRALRTAAMNSGAPGQQSDHDADHAIRQAKVPDPGPRSWVTAAWPGQRPTPEQRAERFP
jgi:hypothetical protein